MTTRASPSDSIRSGKNPEKRLQPIRLFAALLLLAAGTGPVAQALPNAPIPLGLYVEGTFRGNIPGDPEAVPPRMSRSEFLRQIEPLVEKEVADALRTPREPQGEDSPIDLTLDEIAKTGLAAEFDPSLLEVRIGIPFELRPWSIQRILDRGVPQTDKAERPADYAGYLNFYGRSEVSWKSAGNETVFDSPSSLTVQQVANIRTWVAESETYFTGAPSPSFDLDYARLVKDYPELSLRLNAGNLILPAAGLKSQGNLTGIGAARDSAYSFRTAERLEAQQEIVLRSAADVSIYVNDRVVKVLRLPPGRHRIGDFPFLNGLNTLRIEIHEEGSPPRTILLSVPFESGLLMRRDYSYSAAVGTKEWTSRNPVVTAYGRYGLLDYLTVGLNGQAGLDRGLFGAEAIWASPAGNFKTELGVSSDRTGAPDFGGQLQYRLAVASRPDLPVIGVSARYTGKRFLAPGSEAAANDYAWNFSAVASQAVPGGIGLNFGAGYQTGWGDSAGTTTGSFSIMKNFGGGTTLSFFLAAETGRTADPVWKGGVTLTISPPGERTTVNVSHDIVNGPAYVDYQVRPKKNLGSPGYSASLEGIPFGNETASSARIGATYAHELFETSAYNTVQRGPDGKPPFLEKINLSAASALAFSDGTWAVTRPISDSFAIVVPEGIEGRRVRVSSGGDSVLTAKEGEVATVPDIRSYQPRALIADIPELPPGKEAGPRNRLLLPSYKSGYTLRVGITSTRYGKGALTFLDGKPIALQGGEIVSRDDPGRPSFPFYTDEEGSFEYFGFVPGTYELRLFVHEMARIDFTIPESGEAFTDLGNLKLPILKRE